MREVDLAGTRRLAERSFRWWAFTIMSGLLYLMQRLAVAAGAWYAPLVFLPYDRRFAQLLISVAASACLCHFYFRPAAGESSLSFGSAATYCLVRLLPRRLLSRLVGKLFRTTIYSAGVRRCIYSWWCRHYKVVTSEILEPLEQYSSLDAFFTRRVDLSTRRNYQVRPGAHMGGEDCFRFAFNSEALIDRVAPGGEVVTQAMVLSGTCLFSPADSVLSSHGVFSSPFMQTVTCKGLLYSAADLLGISPKTPGNPEPRLSNDTMLHWVVFYLSPGDYHRFHAACDMRVSEYRHVHGDLLPVNSLFMPRIRGLLAANERVVLSGTYRLNDHPKPLYFGYVAVGALNVGNISIRKGGAPIRTNACTCRAASGTMRAVISADDSFSVGEEVGKFHFGSTIVLVYEVPISKRVVHLVSGPCPVRVGDEVALITDQ